jgi:hypothetical protein
MLEEKIIIIMGDKNIILGGGDKIIKYVYLKRNFKYF